MNLPYESIALINSINRPEDLLTGREIVILNIPGLPIPNIPETDLELLIHSWRDLSLGIPITVRGKEEQGRDFMLLPGERFHTLELSYFLGILFRFPLKKANLSSGYGYRQNPFGGGDLTFHHGIDLVAPVGTEVYPAREGKVINRGFDPVYGNLVVLSHPNGYETLYGHLDSIFVQLNQSISSNMILGTVGNTGLSTGPHLHFEVRRNGETTNPALLLPGIK